MGSHAEFRGQDISGVQLLWVYKNLPNSPFFFPEAKKKTKNLSLDQNIAWYENLVEPPLGLFERAK